MAAHTVGCVDGARYGEHLTPLLQGRIGGNQRAALFRRFHHHGGKAQAADDPVSHREMPRLRLCCRRVLRQKHACGSDVLIQPAILRRVHHIHTAAQYGCGKAAGTQCTAMCRRVNAFGKAGYHHRAGFCHLVA